ncbi:hypothetical protein PISMIDRAFT_678385, partial [Pisolithus microcarpus 441]
MVRGLLLRTRGAGALHWIQIREQFGVRTTCGARHLSLEVVHAMKTSPTPTLRTGPYM